MATMRIDDTWRPYLRVRVSFVTALDRVAHPWLGRRKRRRIDITSGIHFSTSRGDTTVFLVLAVGGISIATVAALLVEATHFTSLGDVEGRVMRVVWEAGSHWSFFFMFLRLFGLPSLFRIKPISAPQLLSHALVCLLQFLEYHSIATFVRMAAQR